MFEYMFTNFFFLLGAIVFSFGLPIYFFRYKSQKPKESSEKREVRYLVLKVADMSNALTDEELDMLDSIVKKIDAYRKNQGKAVFECVVVESDWPEYEYTWNSIIARS